jgi:transposase
LTGEPEEAGKDTQMAKSVHDAGRSMLRNMLSYNSIATGGVMRVVPERFAKRARFVGAFPQAARKGLVRFK